MPTRDCTGHTGRAGKRAAKTLTKEPIRSRGGHPGHDQGRRLSIPLVVAPQDLRIIVSKSTRQHRRCRPPGKTLLHGKNSKGQFDELCLHDPQNSFRQRYDPPLIAVRQRRGVILRSSSMLSRTRMRGTEDMSFDPRCLPPKTSLGYLEKISWKHACSQRCKQPW